MSEEKRYAYRVLVEKYIIKRPYRKLRHRWERNINTDHKETGFEDTDYTDLTRDMGKWWVVV